MKETKLAFIADTHHFSKTLADGGRQYQLRSGSDQKCLMETGDIIDAAFEMLKNSDCDAVLIAGDVSDDGERVSHEEFREKVRELQKSKPVYLITATHDWCSDDKPRRYIGNAVLWDVPVLDHTELRDFYYEFGPKQALSEFRTHLGVCSFTVDIGPDVRLLALNDDQSGMGGAGFSEEHFQWIEAQMAKAKEDGKLVIGMQHHPIIAHIHPMLTGGSCVKDREMVASRLADAGLRYMFEGHTHMQAIDSFTSPNGNTITSVNVGSLVGYPAPIFYVTVKDDGLHIEEERVQKFNFEGKEIDAQPYLAKHATDLLDRLVEGALISKDEFADRLSAMGLKGNDFKNLYFIVYPFAKLYFSANVGTLARVMRCVGLGRFLDPAAVAQYRNKPFRDFVHETWLSILDGRGKGVGDEAYQKLVLGVADALVQIRSCKLTLDLRQALRSVITADYFDDAVI